MINGNKSPKDWAVSLPGDNALFAALIITDILAPFFIWPHLTGRFYPNWAVFFSSGLVHWLQTLALLMAWPVLRPKLWGRLGLVLAGGVHLFWPPPALDDQLMSGLAATVAWWLTALPAVLAAGRREPGALATSADTGSRWFTIIIWLVLAANLILILTLALIHPFLADTGGLLPNVGWAALQEMGLFLFFLSILLLAGRRLRLFNAPIYLAALISLGGIWWLWPGPGLTEPGLDAFLTGLLAIHITLMPVLGAVVLVAALIILILRRRPEGFGYPPPPFRPGWLLALVLTPLAGLGLAAIPLWADHLSRSFLDPPPASEPFTALPVGNLRLPIPASLEAANWLTFINWEDDEEEGKSTGPGRPDSDWSPRGQKRERPKPWREVHGMILMETGYANPSLPNQEFEEAWQNLLSRATDRTGFPKTTEELSDRFDRPSRLLIHYYPPRRGGQEGVMIMRLIFLHEQAGGYIKLLESARLETLGIEPDEINQLKAAKKADFLSRVEETVAAYRWEQWPEPDERGAMFKTRFGHLDHSRLRAELEAAICLFRAGEPAPDSRRRRDCTDIRIRSAPPADSASWPRPAAGSEAVDFSDDSPSPQPPERLAPLLGWIGYDRTRPAAGRNGREYLSITTGGWDNSPATINATWSSYDGDLEVEMWSDRRLVQTELPTLTRFWSALLAGPD